MEDRNLFQIRHAESVFLSNTSRFEFTRTTFHTCRNVDFPDAKKTKCCACDLYCVFTYNMQNITKCIKYQKSSKKYEKRNIYEIKNINKKWDKNFKTNVKKHIFISDINMTNLNKKCKMKEIRASVIIIYQKI